MWALILTLLFGSNVSRNAYAVCQRNKPAVSVDDDTLKQIEALLAEVESLRKVKNLNRDQIAALEAKIAALEDLCRVYKEQRDAYKNADTERATANALDDKRIALYVAMVADYKVEISRLRAERDKARGNNKFYLLGGVILGALAAVFARNN
jgi:uncharacterized membrane protein YgaE (UPF0421/DUF939 family)